MHVHQGFVERCPFQSDVQRGSSLQLRSRNALVMLMFRRTLCRKNESAQYYNSHGNSPNQYAMELVGALDASGVPLIVELPQTDGDPPMFSSSALPEVDNGGNIMHCFSLNCHNIAI